MTIAATSQHERIGADMRKRLPKVGAEMALNVLAYNMKRVMAIVGVDELLEVMRA